MKEPLPKDSLKPSLIENWQRFDFRTSLVMRLCRDVCQEVVELQSSSCPKGDWFQCYQVKSALCLKDRQGRSMWYHSSQRRVAPKPTLKEVKENLPIKTEGQSPKKKTSSPSRSSDPEERFVPTKLRSMRLALQESATEPTSPLVPTKKKRTRQSADTSKPSSKRPKHNN